MTTLDQDTATRGPVGALEHQEYAGRDATTLRERFAEKSVDHPLPDLPPPDPQDNLESFQAQLVEIGDNLTAEKQAHNQTKIELDETKLELEETRTRWKEIVKEFNRFQTENQSFVPLDDQVLVQKVSQLRFNIRNFALQYFDTGELLSVKDSLACWNFIFRFHPLNLGPFGDPGEFESWMRTPSRRILAIRAFLWAFLTTDILGEFRWAGRDVTNALYHIHRAFGSPRDKRYPGPDDIQAQRKYHIWKANTTALLVESMGLDQQNGRKSRELFAVEKAKEIVKYIHPYSISKDKHLINGITDIILEALELDLQISQQAARIDWIYDIDQARRFDPKYMDLEGETGEYVCLFVAPALVKRGKSNGEDFDVTNCLLKMQVSCLQMEVAGEAGTHRGPGAGSSFASRMAKGIRYVTGSQTGVGQARGP
ncbi:hypothetical protein F5Y04DRAFT_212829 [Hypomontagnella monticulosa]|nr:hypothetical protein F5Y04DRAFT_212829 [Hypomontagnella monticulosa]